jgi:hypothetical protein
MSSSRKIVRTRGRGKLRAKHGGATSSRTRAARASGAKAHPTARGRVPLNYFKGNDDNYTHFNGDCQQEGKRMNRQNDECGMMNDELKQRAILFNSSFHHSAFIN